ncbi:MAG TPA: M61 family peptidase [Silvibacterium sp.]|nr:M61 family peptidase [Silvibacterium sp.]
MKYRWLGSFLILTSALAGFAQSPITLKVDITDAPRKIIHGRLTIPVKPGPLTLLYPKWIPGEHGPTGPIDNLAGLIITANGQQLPWVRDDVNMYAFRVTVPDGVSSLDVKLDFLATAAPTGFSAGASTSANLAMLSWNEVVLYPAGISPSELQVQPSIKLPADWQYGTALTKTSESNGEIEFAPVSLEMLIDSPLLTGRYFKEFPLAPEISPKHYLDLAADGPEDLAIKPEALEAFSKLVRETGALYKSRHYNSYHFLVTLSDQVAHFGLEHHQSSDDRVGEKTFLDDNLSYLDADLLPHEFTHSWNGKYRRPAGLATGNYSDPMKGNLLWVYEGLTQYLGDVLAARSGIENADQYRSALAESAAALDTRPGRTWRDLQDTATAAQILYDASSQWGNWRRGVDYYPEGELVWLDVDTTIRKLTHDKKSLNDFCARFEGLGGNTQPKVVPYTFDDVVANLNAVVPNDWAAFLRERLTSKSPHAPLEGITQGGYRIVYSDQPGLYINAREAATGDADAWWTIGLNAGIDGRISDVLVGSVSDKAGLGPGMQIVAVNGRQYSASLLGDAITAAKGTSDPIELIVTNTGYYKVVKLDYHDGLRFPHLERVEGTPDYLDEILQPLTKSTTKSTTDAAK